jgi:hypothetical protein
MGMLLRSSYYPQSREELRIFALFRKGNGIWKQTTTHRASKNLRLTAGPSLMSQTDEQDQQEYSLEKKGLHFSLYIKLLLD